MYIPNGSDVSPSHIKSLGILSRRLQPLFRHPLASRFLLTRAEPFPDDHHPSQEFRLQGFMAFAACIRPNCRHT